MCDLVIYSHEEGMDKPDPPFFALACERLGVLPEEMILLDDHEPNLDGATDFSIHAILFRDNAHAIADIEGLLAARSGCRSAQK